MAFPSTLDDFTPKVDNTNDVMAIDINELQTAIEALEDKVGADSSAVTTSHDYKIAQLESGKQDALGFTPENVANKVTSISGSSTDTQYPSAKLVYDQLATKLATSAFTDAAVTGKLLTGYTSGAGTVAATDTILQAIQKLNGNIGAITLSSLGGFSNPMTTLGDIIYGGASGVATRLGLGTAGQVLKVNSGANGIEWGTSSGGTSLWTAITGTRASNTTITVSGDQTAIFKKGMIVRWQESGVDKIGMVSIPSTYSSPNTTITIIGDTCASIDSNSFKYSVILGAEPYIVKFAIAGTIGATATDAANAYYATEPMRVLGADLQVGTAGTTNSTTIDINKGGTTMFTTKPTLASTVATSATPYTADTATSLALADKVTIDIDAVQTTAAIDLYVQLYLFPTRYLSFT